MRHLLVVAVLIPLWVCSCSNPSGSDSSAGGVYYDAHVATLVNAVSADLAAIRGLSFSRPVHSMVMTREYYASMAGGTGLSTTENAWLSTEYKQLGLLDDTTSSFGAIYEEYTTSFPAAFYRTGTDSIYIIDDAYTTTDQLQFYLAHELVHTLQDQNLNLRLMPFPAYSFYGSDFAYAVTSLIEGDAMVGGYGHYLGQDIYGNTVWQRIDDFFEEQRDSVLYFRAGYTQPPFLDFLYYSPYDLGGRYIATLVNKDNSFTSVNALYSVSAVPRSSAEIITTTDFNPHFFQFQTIHDTLLSADNTITFFDDDNGGAALLLGLFYDDISFSAADSALQWRGDRYTFIGRSKETFGTLVWALAFGDSAASDYIFRKFEKKIGNRTLASMNPFYTSKDSLWAADSSWFSLTWNSSLFSTSLYRSGTQVWWIENAKTLHEPIRQELVRMKQGFVAKQAHVTAASRGAGTLGRAAKNRAAAALIEYTLQRNR